MVSAAIVGGQRTDGQGKTFTVFCLVQNPCVCQDEKRFT